MCYAGQTPQSVPEQRPLPGLPAHRRVRAVENPRFRKCPQSRFADVPYRFAAAGRLDRFREQLAVIALLDLHPEYVAFPGKEAPQEGNAGGLPAHQLRTADGIGIGMIIECRRHDWLNTIANTGLNVEGPVSCGHR